MTVWQLLKLTVSCKPAGQLISAKSQKVSLRYNQINQKLFLLSKNSLSLCIEFHCAVEANVQVNVAIFVNNYNVNSMFNKIIGVEQVHSIII